MAGKSRRRLFWLFALAPALLAGLAAFFLLPAPRGSASGTSPEPMTGEMNILIIGRDARAVGPVTEEGRIRQTREESSRSDVMIVAHLNFDLGRANLVALPRDMLVEVPGITRADSSLDFNRMEKLAHVHAIGGERLLRRTIERLLGITIHRGIAFDFDTFRMTFGALAPFLGRLRVSGTLLADRHQALMFARRRQGLADDDLDRCRNILLFVKAVLCRTWWLADTRLGDLTLGRILKVVGSDTDLTAEELSDIAAALNKKGVGPAQIGTAVLAGDGAEVTLLRYDANLSCFLPAMGEIRRQVRRYLFDEDSVRAVSMMTREEYPAPAYLFQDYLLDTLALLPDDSARLRHEGSAGESPAP